MLTYFLEGKSNGNNSQTRSLNLERKMYHYGGINIQTKLGTSCPSVSSSPSLSANAGVGTLQAPSAHLNQTLHYLPSVPAVKESWELWKRWLCHLQSMWGAAARPEFSPGSWRLQVLVSTKVVYNPTKENLGTVQMNSWNGSNKG